MYARLMCVCVSVYALVMLVCMRTYIHTYTHTHTHTYMQITEISNTFKRFDGGTCYLPINALPSFLSDIKRPLGFRDKQGRVHYGYEEKVIELLIRAEVHLHVLDMQRLVEEEAQVWWRRCVFFVFCVCV
jgi:hypothetical protein